MVTCFYLIPKILAGYFLESDLFPVTSQELLTDDADQNDPLLELSLNFSHCDSIRVRTSGYKL